MNTLGSVAISTSALTVFRGEYYSVPNLAMTATSRDTLSKNNSFGVGGLHLANYYYLSRGFEVQAKSIFLCVFQRNQIAR